MDESGISELLALRKKLEEAEQSLQEQGQRFARMLEAATVGVITNDRAGKFTFANSAVLRMLGYSREDLAAGRLNWNLIQLPELRARDDIALEQLRATGSCDPFETELLTSDGRRVPVYMGATLVPEDAEGTMSGAVFVTDLSKIKETERALVDLNAQLDARVKERTNALERANAEMEAFTYHVSHDLRAPIRAIVATSRMLQQDFGPEIPEAAKGLLERQVTVSNKLGQLTDDLLKLTRLAREEVQPTGFDLSALAQELAVEHSEDNRKVEIVVEPGMFACGDPRLVRLLLANLLSNALRYSPGGGIVKIGMRQKGTETIYFVSDQGIGFDMRYASKLFEPFERLVSEHEYPGTGVGLANVARIVAKHKGEVWAESTPGEGSTFYFTLENEQP